VDRGTVLVMVLGAVASATASGTWVGVAPWDIGALIAAAAIMLGLALAATVWASRPLRLTDADATTLQICGSMKSLSTGLPIAGVMFPAAAVGPIAVPVIIFHQLELIAISLIARRRGNVVSTPE
jgi:sodium/bile acid cotransporter 7